MPGGKLAFARVLENRRLFFSAYDEIDGAIIVIVGADGVEARAFSCQTDRIRNVRKGGVTVVAPHHARKLVRREWQGLRTPNADGSGRVCSLRYVQVQVPVVVVVNEGDVELQTVNNACHRARLGGILDVRGFTLDAGRGRNVLKLAVLLVVQQKHADVEAHRQIGGAVVVVVSRGASNPVNGRIEPGFPGHIFKFAVAQVVIQRHAALRTVVGKKNVRLAISVVIQKTCTRPQKRCEITG